MRFKSRNRSGWWINPSRDEIRSTKPAADSPLLLMERLEGRELFSAAAPTVDAPLLPTAAIVARPAAATVAALDGTYAGVAQVSLGKAAAGSALKVKISNDGTRISGNLALSKYYTFKIDAATTFVKTSKHVWTAHVSSFTGDMAIQVKDTGAITISGDFGIPLFSEFKFTFTGQDAPGAEPQNVSASPMIASYNGTLSTAATPQTSYTTSAVIQQASGNNLKLIANITVPTFGTLVGTYVFPSGQTNRFTVTLGKSSSGQTQSITGQLDKRKNLELTFFDPPLATLSGSLNRVKVA